MTHPIELRPEVREFAELMEMNLRANDHKTNWKDCTFQYLFGRLFDELAELGEQFLEPKSSRILVCSDLKKIACGIQEGWFKIDPEYDTHEVLSEIMDSANFLMMLADVVRNSGRRQ